MGRPKESLEQKYLKAVRKNPSGCWSWAGKKHQHGYGMLTHGWPDKQKEFRAHRISYELYIGPIPEGMFVCHKCDNRECTNPEHLFLGNQKDNMGDASQKKRLPYGEKSHSAKLNDRAVKRIRFLHSQGITKYRLADLYRVARSTIREAVNRETWRHVE